MICTLFSVISTWLISWLKNNSAAITTGIIGGTISGLVVYLYVIRTENRREKRNIKRQQEKDLQETKEKCTTALLNTQMTLSFQMDELKGLENLCSSIIHFKLYGASLFDHLNKIEGISAKSNVLSNLINQHKNPPIRELIEFTNHLIITSPVNTVITLPQEVFSLLPIKCHEDEFTVATLANYFKDLASCNRKYMQFISLIEHHNEVRSRIINQTIITNDLGIKTPILEQEEFNKILNIVCAWFVLATSLIEKTDRYLEKADSLFIKTGKYIQLLGITSPIQVARNQDGKPIFDKLS